VTRAAEFVKRVRNERELQAEAEALRAFGVDRAAAVHEVRVETLELVLERVHPGEPLASIATEDEALQVVARLFQSGWPALPPAPVAEPLTTFAAALRSSTRVGSLGAGAQPAFRRAADVLRELLEDERDRTLLHGDLHYGNILSSRRAGYLLIDPKGAIGEPAFDIGYLVSRPMPAARDHLPLSRAISRRLTFLPEALQLDPHRVAAYAYVAAALSLVWAIEDGDSIRCSCEEAMNVLAPRLR
jgi:streptomycin 6-kinase